MPPLQQLTTVIGITGAAMVRICAMLLPRSASRALSILLSILLHPAFNKYTITTIRHMLMLWHLRYSTGADAEPSGAELRQDGTPGQAAGSHHPAALSPQLS